MKKRILIALVLIVSLIVVVAGCKPGEDAPDSTAATLADHESRLATAEGELAVVDLNKIKNDSIWAVSQIGTINNTLAGITNPTDWTSTINNLTNRLNTAENDIDNLQAADTSLSSRITALENGTITIPEVTTLTAELGTGKITITTQSSVETAVVFELTFHVNDPEPIEVGGDTTGLTINDVTKQMYTDNPIVARAGLVNLTPTYFIAYNADDDEWYCYAVKVTTTGTTITAGESVKVVTITQALIGDFVTVEVLSIASETSGGGTTW